MKSEPAERAFVLQNTRLQRVAHVPELRLHLADELMPIWQLAETQLGKPGVPPPFWAFAWIGGLAIARYLLDHSDEVAQKHVLDFAAGSGLCAIAAMKAGAAWTLAADVDRYCEAAVALNAAANRVKVAFTNRDLLDADPPDVDVILAGDIFYEAPVAARVLAWLQMAHSRGTRILLGDPGRTYFPSEKLVRLADYQIQTTRELEDAEIKRSGVFTFE